MWFLQEWHREENSPVWALTTTLHSRARKGVNQPKSLGHANKNTPKVLHVREKWVWAYRKSVLVNFSCFWLANLTLKWCSTLTNWYLFLNGYTLTQVWNEKDMPRICKCLFCIRESTLHMSKNNPRMLTFPREPFPELELKRPLNRMAARFLQRSVPVIDPGIEPLNWDTESWWGVLESPRNSGMFFRRRAWPCHKQRVRKIQK